MKFKVGDKVKVVRCNYHTNCDHVGKEYVIKSTEEKVNPYSLVGCCELFRDDELELVQDKQFTKSDLKDGDIVTYRNGEKRMKIAGKLYDENGTATMWLHSYNEDLTREYKEREETDIIKVERPTSYETLFERKEEILDETEKRYLRDVIRPFRKQLIEIIKWKYTGRDEYFIKIRFKNGDILKFPNFTDKTMYKGMLADKSYTLEQLGL